MSFSKNDLGAHLLLATTITESPSSNSAPLIKTTNVPPFTKSDMYYGTV